ncbi:uncharacterized protein [Eurosta solidaginis]|uniref:uncharacterized protein n=1 Tax=Eurosta solidaginis TaxID=178769 RepID=UPI0035313533
MPFRSTTNLLPRHSSCNLVKYFGRCRAAAYGYKILFVTLLLQLLLSIAAAGTITAANAGTKGLPRMRAAKIARVHGMQVVPESLSDIDGKSSATTAAVESAPKDKQGRKSGIAANSNHAAGKYEIRSVSGEPNYKSVNLTWEVEFVPSVDITTTTTATDIDAITNSSAEVEPPKAFQIFFCELQSFGPHRCRSKLVNQTQQLEQNGYDDNDNVGNNGSYNSNSNGSSITNKNNNHNEIKQMKSSRQIRPYAVQIDNLRMATKYSFHIRPQAKRRNMKITGRSELFGNEIDDDASTMKKGVPLDGGQTIIIPTKGFTAQATKCLPQASEIEVETGPYFGGKIVVDGGNCGLKGNQDDPIDRYTMRIDHKMCGSLVKPDTNTVETFITVQENMGIYTHSTRRFVVVCSFQSGMQTVRASFTVPGSDGVASAVENDPFEPDDRLGREQRFMRFVDKSALILKEHTPLEPASPAARTQLQDSDESLALVEEITDTFNESSASSTTKENNNLEHSDVPNSVVLLEDIVPGVNEQGIKHENDVLKLQVLDEKLENEMRLMTTRGANYAKLIREHEEANLLVDEANSRNLLDMERLYHMRSAGEGRGFTTSLEQISSNAGSVIITVVLSVIVLSVFILVVIREARRQRYIRSNIKMQQLQSTHSSSPMSVTTQKLTPGKRTLPRALQQQSAQGSL